MGLELLVEVRRRVDPEFWEASAERKRMRVQAEAHQGGDGEGWVRL